LVGFVFENISVGNIKYRSLFSEIQCILFLFTGTPMELVTSEQDNLKEEGTDEQKWKKEMEHMRYV